jgi:hypothetical protein
MAKIVSVTVLPWSSTVGQVVTLHDEDGAAVATLPVLAAHHANPQAMAHAVAKRIADAFDALAIKEAHEDFDED